jgi:hypothetical protein
MVALTTCAERPPARGSGGDALSAGVFCPHPARTKRSDRPRNRTAPRSSPEDPLLRKFSRVLFLGRRVWQALATLGQGRVAPRERGVDGMSWSRCGCDWVGRRRGGSAPQGRRGGHGRRRRRDRCPERGRQSGGSGGRGGRRRLALVLTAPGRGGRPDIAHVRVALRIARSGVLVASEDWCAGDDGGNKRGAHGSVISRPHPAWRNYSSGRVGRQVPAALERPTNFWQPALSLSFRRSTPTACVATLGNT